MHPNKKKKKKKKGLASEEERRVWETGAVSRDELSIARIE
jgi:hypothetical protein